MLLKVKEHPIKNLVNRYKTGENVGIFSVCTSNEYVIEGAMERVIDKDLDLLIESTANQVNQDGGYTGMKPKDFVNYVYKIADKVNFPKDRIILGGDHLGPLTWTKLTQEEAMEKAKVLIRDYVLAGFTKIHIDTSMPIYDDLDKGVFGDDLIAERAAILCNVAELSYKELLKINEDVIHPIYVVGSEVPVPGGVQAEEAEEEIENGIKVTRVEDFKNTVEVFKKKFKEHGIEEAFNYVVGVVVQPGVEFSSDTVWKYEREKAKDLSKALKEYDNLVFEAHSTDYQSPKSLREMVVDGFNILKVGPALTFGFREAAFALNKIEEEMFRFRPDIEESRFIQTLDYNMVKHPENWIKHYSGTSENIRFSRMYSLSDRCRYYMPNEEVEYSFNKMINNLDKEEIPIALISQYMHNQYKKVRDGELKPKALNLLKDFIGEYVDDYIFAVEDK
ncbi:D-tagatose-bisphosphate aldolase, class II, non-catalytic subunit [Clostridium thermobutyricum]|uniref:D-tagatose-bisphosphate aldolase, class II, non-catalytic subunit n=1 Tax=Clostridium thermobutyricum TaxID=29372 RepID=N9WHT4_9CLOT|nr:class II D-tagatose-bisphosphate aldolase, non-catalytic subunit [Clostridium thermobutyricum]ENZ02470.1 D-tagatose-bisphosphate aldolase, class II, non-catalytic subunit [Clostridium thermobutyricum]